MKKFEIINLYEQLKLINLSGAKFAYGVAKNIAILTPEVEAIKSAKDSIVNKYAKKDDHGEFLRKNIDEKTGLGEYVIDDEEAFKEEEKKFLSLLEEDIKINLFKIKISDVPDQITTKQLVSIYSIIDDNK